MDIIVNVINQKLRIASNLKYIIAGTQEFIRFVFNFRSDDWDDLMTFAQFIQNGHAYNVYLDDENSVYLPHEITEGKVTLVLRGSGDDTIAITDCVTLILGENILVADADSTEIAQSLYDQLVNKVNILSKHGAVLEEDGIINCNAITSGDDGPTPDVSFLIDNTLTETYKAAGAKTVGDRLATINTTLGRKQNTLTFDSAPTSGSSNPVTSSGIKTALDTKQNNLTFDTAPTANSTNPVTSGGIKTALDTKQDNLVYDTTPTSGSTKPVTSGGIRIALNEKQDNLEYDSTPTADSTKLVTSGGIKTALDSKQDTLTFDTTPTASSLNPVTSGGIKTALNAKQNKLTFDTTPTANSTKPVTSGGVKAALDSIQSSLTVDNAPTASSTNLLTSGTIKTALDSKVDKPTTNPNGTSGQLLQSDGNGGTVWADYGAPSDAQVEQTISDWLTAHPEATTTVADGSITAQKLESGLLDSSEAWAVGQVNGTDVASTDARYHNNSKYYAQQASASATTASTAASSASADAAEVRQITANSLAFTEADTRENIDTGESLSTMLGKIKKWFTDLGAAAFKAVANNLTTASAGTAVLDAYQGKLLNDRMDNLGEQFVAIYHSGLVPINIDTEATITSVPASSTMWLLFPLTKQGYSMAGILGYTLGSSSQTGTTYSWVNLYSLQPHAKGVYVACATQSNGAWNNPRAAFTVLWRKVT